MINGHPRSPVVADSEELDAWILHRIELPPGASRKIADNLQRARELRHQSRAIKKKLQARTEALRKTAAESRAKLRKSTAAYSQPPAGLPLTVSASVSASLSASALSLSAWTALDSRSISRERRIVTLA